MSASLTHSLTEYKSCTWPYDDICLGKSFPVHNMLTSYQSSAVLSSRINSPKWETTAKSRLAGEADKSGHLLQWGQTPLLLWATVSPWPSFRRPSFWKYLILSPFTVQQRCSSSFMILSCMIHPAEVLNIFWLIHKSYFAQSLGFSPWLSYACGAKQDS